MSDLRALVERLNPVCKRALESAVAMCVAQTHYNVEVEHFLVKLLSLPATDIGPVLHAFDVDESELAKQLGSAIEKFNRGNSRTPSLSPQVVKLLREGWLASTLILDSTAIRSGALLLGVFEDESLRATLFESCPALARIQRDVLQESVRDLVRVSVEEVSANPAAPAVETSALEAHPPAGDSALDRFTIDLIADARAGKIDPIRGRDAEIRQVVDILTRRRQNNPILIGEAGVGKTAVVEGFALRVVAGEVPPPLRNIALRVLDLGLLQAGAAMKGEFEQRLKSVIAEVSASRTPVILFVDEAHSLIGAGGIAGQGDAANLLKPALARGDLRTIAATTWSEYKKYFEKDPALTRRFQVVKVDEPDEVAALDMLRGVAPHLERHHNVRIEDGAVRSAVHLAHRYLPERRLPDKAIGVLDTAAARVALAQDGTPAAVENLERRIRIAEAELSVGPRAALQEELAQLRNELEALRERWAKERGLVAKIRGGDDALRVELDALQGDAPLVPLACDERVVAAVIAGWTGIPAGRVLADEVHGVLSLQERMSARIIGQPQALDGICRRISTSRAGLEDPAKPKGVFLLVGPTGVGKTETASALAAELYGGERNLISFNMSEFQEPHSVATLKGAPPGYVGYGRGGVLTEAVRRRPWSAVLLDEIEKAHPDVVDLFYQVFDKGVLDDGEGVPVDFRNTVILLTSNVGADVVVEACKVPSEKRDTQAVIDALRPELLRVFRPALLARLVVVPFYPLRRREIVRIVELKLLSIERRIRENHGAELTYDPRLVESLADRCDPASGAREIDRILTQTLLPELSTRILERMAKGVGFTKIHVSVDALGRFV
ncbi:MAG TPA: type VI secretion system ATPase TssH [Thermoanaerobaculia bacterium]|nr:type VI secretion system ATPase TssH [Thermoanaerobaculia bacterium]